MTNSTYERFKELQASGNLKNRLAKMLQSDMTNQAPPILTHAPGALNYMRTSETVVDHVYHDAYMVNVGQPVYVANSKMVLKKHTTKTMTVFEREQLVIGERMKNWLPFEFSGVTATPTQLFDLGYYVFETENKKWPHMIVEKSLFEEQLAINPELEAIKRGLSQLWIDEAKTEADAREKEKQSQHEENDKNISEMRKYLGWSQKRSEPLYQDKEGQAVEYFKRMAAEFDGVARKKLSEEAIKEFTQQQQQQNTKMLPLQKEMQGIMGIDPDDLGPVIPPLVPMTEKQQKKMKRTNKCPDCAHKMWQYGSSASSCRNIKCANCGSKFNVMSLGIERI